jgi:uncharacterized protein YyaL (SSP411 family)
VLGFVKKEWFREQEGCFYSAYDADSDGEEGKYYVWKKEDLEELLGEKYALFKKYFRIDDVGYWEHGNYILMRSDESQQLLTEFNMSADTMRQEIEACKDILKQESLSRIKPGLDDKSITSWNAMMCSAYAQAAMAFNNDEYAKIAAASLKFLTQTMQSPEGKLYRTYKNGHAKINGFLEDYAFTIEALLNCYLLTADEGLLHKAKHFCEMSLIMQRATIYIIPTVMRFHLSREPLRSATM